MRQHYASKLLQSILLSGVGLSVSHPLLVEGVQSMINHELLKGYLLSSLRDEGVSVKLQGC